ncbi:MAG: type IV pilus secretin PilQ [Deltaproteobacteria bacterium]|nr:type IV pilus secretin PilQ [Deltaproteobacteria bacterium]
MRAFTAINRIKLLVVMSLLMASGCAQNAYSVKEDSATGSTMVILRDITVSGEGRQTKIVISANKPLTYTSYSLKGPNRTILDLSQTDPGTAVVPQLAAGSLIKKMELSSTDLSGGSLVRVTIEPKEETEFIVASDPSDQNKLVVSISDSPAVTQDTGINDTAPSSANQADSTPAASAAIVPTALTEASSGVADVSSQATSPADKNISGTRPIFSEATLSSLDVTKDGIVLHTGMKVDKYKYFQLSKPERLVIDLYKVKNALSEKSIPINSYGIENARLGSYPDKVRIVLDTQRTVFPAYSVEKMSDGLLLRVQEQQTAAVQQRTTPAGEVPTPTAARVKPAVKGPASVEAVDFQVIDGVSRVAVSLTGDCDVKGPTRTSDGLMLTFSKCLLPKHLQRPFDTSAFPGVVKKITPYQVMSGGHKDTKIQISLREDAPYSLQKKGDVYLLDVTNPPQADMPAAIPAERVPVIVSAVKTSAPSAKTVTINSAGQKQPYQPDVTEKRSNKKVYTGKRVTLEFADADIRKIFQLIAEVSNLNFLVGDDVTGTISIKLVNVPWDQALDVILETKNLGMKQDGNIVLIRPIGKIMSFADEELAAKRAYEKTLELRTKIFDINFAAVGDIAGQFQSFKSERGTISVDNRTNRVIVTDIQPAIEKMASLLKALDIPEKQVLIEARIVEASSSFTQDLGIQWGIHYREDIGLDNDASLDTGFGGIVTNIAPRVGLPAASAAGGALGLSFGKLTSNVQVDMRLSAAAESGQIKIISTPKVVTLNNKSAKISQGQMIPYSTVSAEGTKTEFVEAALTLEVTPHITADGSVSMKITASNNSAGSAAAGVAPPINKKEATTELLVKSGETTVIGGIYVDTDTNTDSGVPYLMDIPLLGWLFKSNNQQKNKSELLIFITPKIVI